MIRKITFINPRAESWEFNEFKPTNILSDAAKACFDNELFYSRARILLELLKKKYEPDPFSSGLPNESVKELIESTFGMNYDIKIKTKKSRVYYVHGGLYIHEEDTV